MSDLRDRLERRSERFELEPGALQRTFDRGMRVQRRRRIEAGLVALVVGMLGLFVAISTFGNGANVPVDRPSPSVVTSEGLLAPDRAAPALGTVTLGDLSVTVPDGWFLNASDDQAGGTAPTHGTAPILGPVMWLSNFAPPLTKADPCTGMPQDGAILVIDPASGDENAPPWPVGLAPASDPRLACGVSEADASWSWNGHGVAAMASFGPAVSYADRRAVENAFASLAPVAGESPFEPSAYCPPHTVNASQIVAAGSLNTRPWSALVTPSCAAIDVATGRTQSGSGGSLFEGFDDPQALHAVVTTDRGNTFVFGLVPNDAARVVVDSAGAPTITATIAPLGTMQAFAAAVEGLRTGTIASFDASGGALGTFHFSFGMDCRDMETCGQPVRSGDRIAWNEPTDPSTWELREVEGSIVLTGENDTVLARAGSSPSPLTAAAGTLSDGRPLVFGVVGQGASYVLVHMTKLDEWLPVQMVPLEGDRFAFSVEPGSDWAPDLAAAVDASCRVLATVDVRTGDVVQGPDRLRWCEQG